MPTLSISVSEEIAQRLQEIAAAALVTPEAVVEELLESVYPDDTKHPGKLLLEAEAPTEFEPQRIVRLRQNRRFFELKYVDRDQPRYREGEITRATDLKRIYEVVTSDRLSHYCLPQHFVQGVGALLVEEAKDKVRREIAARKATT